MKKKYFSILFFFLTPLLFHSVYGQCEAVTLESLSIPGPFSVAVLDEEDGIRNGPDYNGATIYYPPMELLPMQVLRLFLDLPQRPRVLSSGGLFTLRTVLSPLL